MAPAAPPPETAGIPIAGMRFRVLLSDEIARTYQDEADRKGVDIEELLSLRLANCIDHGASKPIYFNDAERQEAERMLGKNIFSTRDLLTLIRAAVSVRVHNLRITLKPALLQRLKSRCLGVKWEEFLEKVIVEDLERYAGMR